jgi:hypothetical protein
MPQSHFCPLSLVYFGGCDSFTKTNSSTRGIPTVWKHTIEL